MSFIQMAKLNIDLEDQIIESSVLAMDPIKINFQRPGKYMPKSIPYDKDANSSTLFVDMKVKILHCIDLFKKEEMKEKMKIECLQSAIKCLNITNPTDGTGEGK